MFIAYIIARAHNPAFCTHKLSHLLNVAACQKCSNTKAFSKNFKNSTLSCQIYLRFQYTPSLLSQNYFKIT